jgi:arginine decarboxylase
MENPLIGPASPVIPTSEVSNHDANIHHSEVDPLRLARKWTREDALDLYNIEGWGSGYFSINDKGNLTMLPQGEGGPSIEILDIVEELTSKGIALPCIIRFQDILRDRVRGFNELFKKVLGELKYQGSYRGVYPIKVNQLREVIEEIIDAGSPYHYGLEAGSKAELQVVLAYNTDPEALTICNGYKDSDYIRLALLGRQLGRKIMIVIEQPSEMNIVIKAAKETGIMPMLGLRAKLASKGSGKWQDSGGDSAKFGLSSTEIMDAVNALKAADMLSCLQLLHFHIGSQIPDIHSIREAVMEGARFYTNLHKLGAPLGYVDIGGGLGVDYDGSQSNSDYSINYTLEDYITNVAETLQQICDEQNVPHPHIVSESGRAMTAHHSCLIMNVIGSNAPMTKPAAQASESVTKSEFAQEVYELLTSISPKNALRHYHDAHSKREEALSRFKLGLISLDEKAFVEDCVREIQMWILKNRKRLKRQSADLDDIAEQLTTQYLVNFSVFQSAPDHWAFDQLFPIVPIHRMLETPRKACSLVDITCDSDGIIDRFIARQQPYDTGLWLHQLTGRPYYLGMFLTGAYQDIMGDMHNLFGRVNEVHVFCDDDDPEDFYIQETIPGDTISSVLEENQFIPAELAKRVRTSVEERVREGKIKPRDGVQLIDFYEKVMQGYTYLRN